MNRFDGLGEMFCGWMEDDLLVAVGGLTVDPFLGRPEVGRIRRVYVRSAWRGQGIGTEVVRYLVGAAKESFRGVRLRAENADAARLYERLSFVAVDDSEATHVFWF